MNTRLATKNDASVLIRAMAQLVADRDGIHPAHAENRVRAACRLVDVAEEMWNVHFTSCPIELDRHARRRIAERAGVQASEATWELALTIYYGEHWDSWV